VSLLAPLFLLGGLAVALPVVFHLVRRSSRERMTFSSLMFLRPTPPRMTRRNRLEHVFLLLLRCLVICLLSLGFARPFFQKPMAAAPVTGAGAQIVLLLDTSASMRREGVWSEALARAEVALRRTTAADQVAVLAFDDQVRTVVSFEDWAQMPAADCVNLTKQRLAETTPTSRATHLGNALIAAADLLDETDKREQHLGPRRIMLMTDLQEGGRLEGLQGHEWPRGLEVVVDPVKAKRPTNAGLQWVTDIEDSEGGATEASTRVRVSNSADAGREQFQVGWVGVADAPTMDVYVPPGQSRVVPAPQLPDGVSADRLALSGDDEDFDNLVYVVRPTAEEVNVMFLGEDSEKDPAQLLYYLKRAFQETRRQRVTIRSFAAATPLPNLAPDTSRLVIVNGSLTQNRADDLRKFLNGGGTVLFVMNDAASAKPLADLLGTGSLTASEATVANYAMLGQMDFEHPLLAPFADPRFGDFTKIRFWKDRQLALESLPAARVIARFDNDDPAIVEVPTGGGRILVFTFSWRPADSQFALSSKFVPLLYSVLDLAGGGKAQPIQHTVGDAVDLTTLAAGTSSGSLSPSGVGSTGNLPVPSGNLPDGAGRGDQSAKSYSLQRDVSAVPLGGSPSGAGGSPAPPMPNKYGSLSVRKPDSGVTLLPAGETRFNQTDQPGIYEVLNAATPTRFAVNLDPSESRTAPLSAGELERLGVPMKTIEPSPAQLAARQQTLHGAELEARQKVWRWLIVTALAVLLVETWLAGWLTRRSATRVEAAA